MRKTFSIWRYALRTCRRSLAASSAAAHCLMVGRTIFGPVHELVRTLPQISPGVISAAADSKVDK